MTEVFSPDRVEELIGALSSLKPQDDNFGKLRAQYQTWIITRMRVRSGEIKESTSEHETFTSETQALGLALQAMIRADIDVIR